MVHFGMSSLDFRAIQLNPDHCFAKQNKEKRKTTSQAFGLRKKMEKGSKGYLWIGEAKPEVEWGLYLEIFKDEGDGLC